MMSSATWDGQDHHMAATSEDDFNQFLDISNMGTLPDGMPFDFTGFQHHAHNGQPMMAHHRDQVDALMTDDSNQGMLSGNGNMMPARSSPAVTSAASHPSISAHMMQNGQQGDLSNIDAQIRYLQQQKMQQQQRQLQEHRAAFFSNNHNHSVPPTPQSLEMPPGSAQFYPQSDQISQQHGGFDRSDMAFTPLVSPAVTPLDPHFNMEGAFTVPNAYFSPLTSPALHAQHESPSVYDHSTRSNNSPAEMDLEAPAMQMPNMDLAKKARKNNAAKAKTQKSVAVKSSPISKPMRRKTGPSPAIVSKVLTEADERGLPMSEAMPAPAVHFSTESPEDNDSVSPENLSEMPPPPVPARRSTSKSPYIQALNGKAPASHVASNEVIAPHPATPASLMKLPASKAAAIQLSGHQDAAAMDHIESLELPESVSKRPLAPVNSHMASQSPRIEPNLGKAAHSHPLQSPLSRPTGMTSASASPQLRPGSSGPVARKTPQLASRNSRKRSTGSIQVSPALLPRISPNIKPLLPGTPGMSAEDTASRLLMSKSNYQNIIEGNTVPGVSYPTELSTNLTSKRTSHKIAEQGRRNRINSALQEMAALLPESAKIGSGDDSDRKDSKQPNNAPNSKASVVENAIVYMKNLTDEKNALGQENVDLKQEILDLKNKLSQLGAG